MSQSKCKRCGKIGNHYCEAEGRHLSETDDGDFFLSAVVGYATDSAILGGLVGGNFLGGIVGDLLNDSDSGDSCGGDD